jgi:hypothetical protein
MKIKGSNKMARHASMDLAGFDLPAGGFDSGGQHEGDEHTYPTAGETTEMTEPQPQLNLAAIRQSLDNNGSGPRGSFADLGEANGNSNRSIDAAADPADIVSHADGARRRRRQSDSSGSLVRRFTLGRTASAASSGRKMTRRTSVKSAYTEASSSIGSSNVSVESNLWTKLLASTNASLWNDGGFENDDDDDEGDIADGTLPSCNQAAKTWCRGNAYEAKHVSYSDFVYVYPRPYSVTQTTCSQTLVGLDVQVVCS